MMLRHNTTSCTVMVAIRQWFHSAFYRVTFYRRLILNPVCTLLYIFKIRKREETKVEHQIWNANSSYRLQFSKLSSFSMKTIYFFFFRWFLRKDSFANNDQTCLVALWLLGFFRCLRVCAAREKFFSTVYLPATVYTADVVIFWRRYLNCHRVQPGEARRRISDISG